MTEEQAFEGMLDALEAIGGRAALEAALDGTMNEEMFMEATMWMAVHRPRALKKLMPEIPGLLMASAAARGTHRHRRR
jgi:hypothetical protein